MGWDGMGDEERQRVLGRKREDHMGGKEQKLLKRDNMGVAEDRISKLPNTLLHYILSFLSTKEVVATSVLSTTWKTLWTSVPKLYFTYHGYSSESARKFMNSIDRVLLSHNLSIIKTFSLSCSDCDNSRINAWLSVIARHKVQELNLCLFAAKDSIVLPPSLFSCQSLTVLTLSHVGVVKLPSSISFPHLKILILTSLKFYDQYLTESFSSCPVLEELIISNCAWVNNSNKISISNPALKRLEMECTNNNYSRYEGGNIDFIKMDASSLVSLRWVSVYLPIECSLSDMPSLVSAEVMFEKFRPERPKEEMALVSCKLLEGLSHVKTLKISGQILSHAKDYLNDLPIFENLLQLEVDKEFHLFSTRSLLHLPRISLYLETLVFKGERPYPEDGDGWILEAVPQCLLLHLKRVDYYEFEGHRLEFDVIKYLLENARNGPPYYSRTTCK